MDFQFKNSFSMEKRLLPTAGLIVVQDHKLLLAYSKNKKSLVSAWWKD